MVKGPPEIPDFTILCRKEEIKLFCSYFSHGSFVTLDKSFQPGSAHIPAGNGTEVLEDEVNLEGLTFRGLSRFNSFYKPGCLSGHLMPNFPLIFPLTPCWLPPPQEPSAGIPSSHHGSLGLAQPLAMPGACAHSSSSSPFHHRFFSALGSIVHDVPAPNPCEVA